MPASTGSPIKTQVKKFLPLPPSVLPLPEGPGGYRLQRAGERGYVVISGFVQAAFVVTGEAVVLDDAAAGAGWQDPSRSRLRHRPDGGPPHLHPLPIPP